MKDRVSSKPGRIKLTKEGSVSPEYYYMEMADQPSVPGTPLNKNSLLTDATSQKIFGNYNDKTVDQALDALASNRMKTSDDKVYTCYPDLTHPYLQTEEMWGYNSSYSSVPICFTKNYILICDKATVNVYNKSSKAYVRSITPTATVSSGAYLQISGCYSSRDGDVFRITYYISDGSSSQNFQDIMNAGNGSKVNISISTGYQYVFQDNTYVYYHYSYNDGTYYTYYIVRYNSSNLSQSPSTLSRSVDSLYKIFAGVYNNVVYFIPYNTVTSSSKYCYFDLTNWTSGEGTITLPSGVSSLRVQGNQLLWYDASLQRAYFWTYYPQSGGTVTGYGLVYFDISLKSYVLVNSLVFSGMAGANYPQIRYICHIPSTTRIVLYTDSSASSASFYNKAYILDYTNGSIISTISLNETNANTSGAYPNFSGIEECSKFKRYDAPSASIIIPVGYDFIKIQNGTYTHYPMYHRYSYSNYYYSVAFGSCGGIINDDGYVIVSKDTINNSTVYKYGMIFSHIIDDIRYIVDYLK